MSYADLADPLAGVGHHDYPATSWWRRIEAALSGLDAEGLRAALESCREDKRSGYAPTHNEDAMYAIRKRLKQVRD